MAYVKITDLNFAQTLTGSEILPIVQSGTSYKVSVSSIQGNISSGTNNIDTGTNNVIIGGCDNSINCNNNFSTILNSISSNIITSGTNPSSNDNHILGGFCNTIFNKDNEYGRTLIFGSRGSLLSACPEDPDDILDGTPSVRGSVIVGGKCHINLGQYSSILGGEDNYNRSTFTTIAGGKKNYIISSNSRELVDCGYTTGCASSWSSSCGSFGTSIIGGYQNKIYNGTASSILGGSFNKLGLCCFKKSDHNTIVGGYGNALSGKYDTILGGYQNSLSANYSFILGGKGNKSYNIFSFIGGGCNNSISKISNHGIILGGGGNCIDGHGHTYIFGEYKAVSNVIVAGAENEILSGTGNFIHNSRDSSICCSDYSTIFGSKSRIHGGTHSSVFGNVNIICQGSNGTFNCIGGGSANRIEQICSGSVINNIINGGQSNCIINGTSNVIGGGSLNKIFDPLSGDSNFSVIGGGNNNIAGTGRASILGGGSNKNYGINSSILGGFRQTICGNYSMLGAGSYNASFSGRSDILGGKFNINKGEFSTILNGVSSVINSGHNNTTIAGTHICTVSSNMLHANTLYLSAAALPTIDPGVPGVVWRDGTDLKISV